MKRFLKENVSYCFFYGSNTAQSVADFLIEYLLKTRDDVQDKSSWVKILCFYLKAFSQKEYATEIGATILRFVPDEYNMAYHSKSNTWQRKFGYNILYDEIFDMATEMKAEEIFFNVDGEEYTLWMWKGDYWNLGSNG